jgi:hypothetical protein
MLVSELEAKRFLQYSIPNNAFRRDLDLLRARGILAYDGLHWRFVLPTIQEYLAAQHINRTLTLDEVISRVPRAAARTWMQVLQFVIEQHQEAMAIIRSRG